jgi:hypothetical protein
MLRNLRRLGPNRLRTPTVPIFNSHRTISWLPSLAGIRDRVQGIAKNHARLLMGLFSVSFFANLANFGVTTLLVFGTSASLFASYLVAQSVYLLSTSLADGGLATAARIIASQERPDALLIGVLQRVLNRYAALLAILAFAVIAVLAGAFSRFDRPGGIHVPTALLIVCAGIGVIQARGGMCAALIYSGGQFRPYSIFGLAPAVIRMLIVSIFVIARVHITLPILLANDLAIGLVAWLYGALWLRRLRKGAIIAAAACNAPVLSPQVQQLLRSGMIPAFLEAVALQSVVLAGSAFGTGVAVATFGIFLRAIQIIKVVIDPLITYGERRLRLAAPAQRRRAEFSLLGFVAGTYGLLAFGIMVIYIAASSLFHHYALGHSFELAFCLTSTPVAFMYLCLDSILLARGHSNFRLIGTILQVVAASLLVLIMHPATLWQLIFLNSFIALPRFAFYCWFYLRRLSEPAVWSLWVTDAVTRSEQIQ